MIGRTRAGAPGAIPMESLASSMRSSPANVTRRRQLFEADRRGHGAIEIADDRKRMCVLSQVYHRRWELNPHGVTPRGF
jgi:hypothetical protein